MRSDVPCSRNKRKYNTVSMMVTEHRLTLCPHQNVMHNVYLLILGSISACHQILILQKEIETYWTLVVEFCNDQLLISMLIIRLYWNTSGPSERQLKIVFARRTRNCSNCRQSSTLMLQN